MVPIVAALIAQGLPILANAILNKGQQAIEEKLGVKMPGIAELNNPEIARNFKQMELDHEEFLITMALEDRKLDIQEFAMEVADKNSARQREVEIEKLSDRPWYVPSFLDCLTLVVVIGGAYVLFNTNDESIKYAVVLQMGTVLAYYYGTTKNSGKKDDGLIAAARRK